MITPAPKPKRRSPKAPTRVPRKRTKPRRAVGKCPELVAWVRAQKCWVDQVQPDEYLGWGAWADIQAAHLPRTRRLGGDLFNVIPLCQKHHRRQHDIGVDSFLAEIGATRENLADAAIAYTRKFCRETGYVVPEGDQT